MKIIIHELTAQQLIKDQFPEFQHFDIRPAQTQGHNTRTFRLGNNLLLHLPSVSLSASNITKEQAWLPKIAEHISIPISKQIALGKPTKYYPFHWAIYEWISGESADNLHQNDLNLSDIAVSLAQFLKELESVHTLHAPVPGLHNFHRGGSLRIYHKQTMDALQKLSNFIDIQPYEILWNEALHSNYQGQPVWIHGDMSAENLLIENKKLKAVVGFSSIAQGDPAYDLTIAWTFFDAQSRKIFRSNLSFDDCTWVRAQALAMCKSLITLAYMQDLQSPAAIDHFNILQAVIDDHHIKYYFKITPKSLRTFSINDNEKIVLELSHPYDQLHCCYNPTIHFMQYNHKMSINKGKDARDLTEQFIKILEKCLENKLPLPHDIQDLGIVVNQYRNQNPKKNVPYEPCDLLDEYVIVDHDYFMMLYNDKHGNIMLQISPAYPLRNRYGKKRPSYNNFLRWMKKSYKTKATCILSKEIAKKWLYQLHQILKIITTNISEAFKKPSENE
ncbi:aminoglycoside phosphotransferase family protein [Candidatus Chromulinivorax destructor]|uniref:aminoglycoside phosphotransferase family protein n=1 Tax=Candidatus Chromulinivorax destructor TaxID=2066483 RepID=UPI0013B3F0B3|nr:aminoglycoside phosphotransferase family protein [Candidatus Chromulinivorax destructor]